MADNKQEARQKEYIVMYVYVFEKRNCLNLLVAF